MWLNESIRDLKNKVSVKQLIVSKIKIIIYILYIYILEVGID